MTTVQTQGIALAKVKFARLKNVADIHKPVIRRSKPPASGLVTMPLANTPTHHTIAISFQIMTRAEPADMVMATIESLLNIKAPQDEIIIIDNNHCNKALYEPLQQYCDGLSDELNVHFYHEDYIAGYKAGALNFALARMDNGCNYIVVVDSDYQALPNARTRIVSAIERYPNQALLQFPQYYRDSDKLDVHSELNHYFSYHLRRPFNQGWALSTGTFAVINKQALLQLGGWSRESITEDAQMGVLMHRAGETTQFIPEVIATGMLPQTLADLIGQRRRWIYGNMQVLLGYFKKSKVASYCITNGSSHNKFAMIRAHLSQLSAWVNFTGVFILLQSLAVILLTITAFSNTASLGGALTPNAKADLTQFAVSALTVSFMAYAFYLGRRLIAYLRDTKPLNQSSKAKVNSNFKTPLNQRLKAFLVHISFWELGALSWLPVLWGQDKPFVCTPKLTATTSTFKKVVNSIMVMPKLLIGLNVLTAILMASISPVLFWIAMGVVVIKLMASAVVIYNFVAKSDDKVVKPSDDVRQNLKVKGSKSKAKPVIANTAKMTDVA